MLAFLSFFGLPVLIIAALSFLPFYFYGGGNQDLGLVRDIVFGPTRYLLRQASAHFATAKALIE